MCECTKCLRYNSEYVPEEQCNAYGNIIEGTSPCSRFILGHNSIYEGIHDKRDSNLNHELL